MKFPTTWREVEDAPWCDFTERYPGEDGMFIHVSMAWLPPDHDHDWACSARGDTLKEALEELRSEIWPFMRDPSTGKPVSKNHKHWAWQ